MNQGNTGTAAGAGKRAHNRKLQNYLIDRAFQLRWVGAVIFLTVLLVGVFGGYIVYSELHTSEAVAKNLQNFYEPETAAEIAEAFQVEDNGIMWGLLATGLGLILSLAGVGILVTHKVAGPMVGLKFSLDSVARGHYNRIRGFRQGDAFPAVSQSLLAMGAALREREQSEIQRLENVLESSGLGEEAAVALSAVVDEKKARLG